MTNERNVEQIYNETDEALLSQVEGRTSKPAVKDRKSRLESLGFKAAGQNIDRAERMAFAYKLYLYVPAETIDAFIEKLRKGTLKEDKKAYQYKKLVFIPIDQYNEVPPDHVLTAIERAQQDRCFDRFEVAKIKWIEQIKDPIVFGRVDGCSDRFFIAQWDDDVSIKEILDVSKEKKASR